MRNFIITIVVIVIIIAAGFGLYLWLHASPQTGSVSPGSETTTGTTTPSASTAASSTPQTGQTVIGKSVQGRDITAYNFVSAQASTTGNKKILFVAGLHGGYEWNTVLLAYQLIDYLTQNPSAVPAGEIVTVIPDVNPDGLYKVTGKDGRFSASDVSSSQSVQVSGRFNADNVDLNRNFDCDWQATGTWRSTPVSGGTAAFSEPESSAIRDYITANPPAAVVVYYSAAGGVYASNCHAGVLPETDTLTSVYSNASGYPAYQSWNFYQVTGDMVNWLAKENIPAISVLLTNHTDTEWTKNEAGISAVLEHYAQQ